MAALHFRSCTAHHTVASRTHCSFVHSHCFSAAEGSNLNPCTHTAPCLHCTQHLVDDVLLAHLTAPPCHCHLGMAVRGEPCSPASCFALAEANASPFVGEFSPGNIKLTCFCFLTELSLTRTAALLQSARAPISIGFFGGTLTVPSFTCAVLAAATRSCAPVLPCFPAARFELRAAPTLV